MREKPLRLQVDRPPVVSKKSDDNICSHVVQGSPIDSTIPFLLEYTPNRGFLP